MTDIELPNLPRPSGWAPTLKGDIYVADKVREYATAAILADREKRAQAAQPDSALLQVEIAGLESSVGHLSALVDEQRRLLVEVEHVCGSDDYGVEFEDGDSELIDLARCYTFFNGSHALTNYPAFARAVLLKYAAPSPTAEQTTPPASSPLEAARSVAKWLNERPNRPINLEDVAMLVHHVQSASIKGGTAE